MKSVLSVICCGFLLLTAFGCARNNFTIPRDEYEKKVRVLGVLPLFVDAESDIRYPEKEALVALVRDANRKNEQELPALVKEGGNYFAVRLLEGDPDELFARLMLRRERKEVANSVFNQYAYKGPELREFIVSNNVDAVMLVVVNGLTRKEKVYASNYLSYLEADYAMLDMAAQVVDREGNILWEYPRIKNDSVSLKPLLVLQYPDFGEAQANASDEVDVKYKTIAGITRILGKTKPSPVIEKFAVSTAYEEVFEDIVKRMR